MGWREALSEWRKRRRLRKGADAAVLMRERFREMEERARQQREELERHRRLQESTDRLIASIDEREVAMLRARELMLAFADLERIEPVPPAPSLISPQMALRLGALPLRLHDTTLYVGMAYPTDLQAIDELSQATGKRIVPVLTVPSALEEAIKRHYGSPDRRLDT